MNILTVYAHHEPSSFVAAIHNTAVDTLTKAGHKVIVSDLYGLGFNAPAQKWDFVSTSGGHFNYVTEQKHAANLDMAFSPDILAEIQKVRESDMVLFVFPLWWGSAPAILKGWFDRVLAMGVAWDGGQMYQNGLMKGKSAMLAVSAGHPSEFYQEGGIHQLTMPQALHHINHMTLAFCGFNVHESYVVPNALGQPPAQLDESLKEFQFRLQHLEDSPQWLSFYPQTQMGA
jgi:NAD(P)H dehydrogenase (quinone)